MSKVLKILSFCLILFTLINTSYAQENSITTKGTIKEIVEEYKTEDNTTYQKLNILLEDNTEVLIENNPMISSKNIEYKVGDKVILQSFYIDNQNTYVITDYNRTGFLLTIFIVFVVLSIAVGKKYGFYSILGMAFSFFIIFSFILPRISDGKNPIVTTIIASMFIIPVTFYLSHGFNKKTHVAIFSTLITLFITSLLTALAVNLAKLTGYSSDEAMFLQIAKANIDMKGILLAGIIIGFLGVLDDVTVSQSSVVMQLKNTDPNLGTLDLYKKSMSVGRDHITSMINTLFLVYAGASMPLLLLFTNNSQPFTYLVNIELVADEIIRTLVGSIGLILAVPLTSFIASVIADVE